MFAEGFVKGHEHHPEAILLPQIVSVLVISRTGPAQDDTWVLLLSSYYNPATRQSGDVTIKKTRV